ncbi:helix-turn-helix domain-containing protein, partial [Nostoc sp. CENA67]|nr:helix-turn-helix domain-containing protein [Amazonocrinis nigriterrae CENA67]
MSFVVVGKSPKAHYTQISNALIRNSEIDDSTFRLICWMSSHDEGYQINFKNIQLALGYGRDKLRKILKNAEAHNYLVRRKIRTDGGLFDFEYHIFKDTSHAIAFANSLPQSELTNYNSETDVTRGGFTGGGQTGGGSTRGGFTGGGSAGGGSTGGGESAPLLEEQY